MEKSPKILKVEEGELPYDVGLEEGSTDIIVDTDKMDLELLKSTRDNFMVWKDYDY